MADYKCFDELVERNYDEAKRYCGGVAKRGSVQLDNSDFEDIFHSTLMKVREKFSQNFRESSEAEQASEFIRYVGGFFRWEVRNYWRVHSRKRERNLAPEKVNVMQNPRKKEQEQRQSRLNAWYDSIHSLELDYREPLLMQLQGMEVIEIAKALDRKPQTIYNRLQIARDKLRETPYLRSA